MQQLHSISFVYIDDLIVELETVEEHLKDLDEFDYLFVCLFIYLCIVQKARALHRSYKQGNYCRQFRFME